MKIPSAFLALGLLLCLPACDIETDQDSGSGGDTDGGAGSGGAPPSNASVSSCRDACDGLQFFDCIDGGTHETCWNACPHRSDDDLELFASCVMNSLPNCDPDCLDGLLDAPEPQPEPTTDGGSDGAGTTSCEDACQTYVDAGCDVSELSEAPSCAQACGVLSPDEQDLVAACLNSPATCEINPLCLDGGGEDGGAVDETGDGDGGGSVSCHIACDELLFYDCLTPSEHSNCYDVCDAATGNDADTFVSCVDAVIPKCDPGCYEVFVG